MSAHDLDSQIALMPPALRAWLEANREKVHDVGGGPGYSFEDEGFSYDVKLAPGWRTSESELFHSVIEGSEAQVLEKLRGVVPCSCGWCVKRLSSASTEPVR